MTTRKPSTRLPLILAVPALCGSCAARNASTAKSPKVAPAATRANDATLQHVETFYTQLLGVRRPDLAAAYGLPPKDDAFEPLNESELPAHVQDLNLMLADLDKVPAGPRADTLRARITRELLQYGPQGPLRRDPFLWVEILQAAVMAPLAGNPLAGCDETHRIELRLRSFPEALRGATVLLKGSPAPDS